MNSSSGYRRYMKKGLQLFSIFLFFMALSCHDGKSYTPDTVTGTAASGAPVANGTVTFKDRNGQTRQAKTSSNGTYSMDIKGMATPILVKVDKPGGGSIYSIVYGPGVYNTHPFTDLVLSLYYKLKNTDTATVFAGYNSSSPVPTQEELQALQRTLIQVLAHRLNSLGVDPDNFDFFKTPFNANGQGFDRLLDISTFTQNGGATVVKVDDGQLIQTLTLTPNAGNNTIQFDQLTNIPNSQEKSQFNQTVLFPLDNNVKTAETNAKQVLENFRTKVNTKGSSLADSDITPFLSTSFLHNGDNQASWAAKAASFFRGVTIQSVSLGNLQSYDNGQQILTAPVIFQIIFPGSSSPVPYRWPSMAFKQEANGWVLYGNQRIGDIRLWVENRVIKDNLGSSTKKVVFLEVRGAQGSITSVTANGGIYNNQALTKKSLAEYQTIKPTPSTSQTLVTEVWEGTQEVTTFPAIG
ncbi:MAG: carboxypeptidase regulatory-like domain-containing protein, partial [Planctomycetota bacterium]